MNKINRESRDLLQVSEQGGEEMAEEQDRRQNTASCSAITTRADHRGQGTLFRLPRELRDEIYDYLLASGDLQILRTSRPLSQEALRSLYRKAVFKVHMNSTNSFRNVKPSKNVVDKIQNIKIQWDLSDFSSSHNAFEIIVLFHGYQVARGTCHVLLRFDAWRAALLRPADIHALRILRVFRTVMLEVKIKDSTSAISSDRLDKLRSRTLSVFRVLSDELRAALGSADQREDADARYLVFRPSEMLGNRFSELPLSNTAYGW